MDFDLDAFTAVERMRGDLIHLVGDKVLTEGDSRYGTQSVSVLDITQVPGYAINNRNSEGFNLAGGKRRYDASYYAFLNVHAGFDPNSMTSNSFLMVNQEGLYEMKYLESVRHYGIVFYAVYELDETDKSKKLFEQNKCTLLN